jgi:arabinan endo-1,5-alpha-L-arabinosidase
MKSRFLLSAIPALFSLVLSSPAFALDGQPFIHDPSSVVQCDGKWYTFGTGGGGLISEDGWTWHSGAQRPGGGAAPDAIKIGDRYLIVYGATGGGLGGGHNGRILTMWNKTLDPSSPDFKFTDAVVVASSDGIEDCDAIDPALLLDPTTGRLWCSYGTFFGFIRLVELDPKTGARVEGNQALNIAIDCEGTGLVYHDGWYYLMGTHGTCCSGASSTYNIVAGRSKSVTGPYLDNMGVDMLMGGGKFVVGANNRHIGAGHFGLTDLGEGVQKFSCHYEADLNRGGSSILEVRGLVWKDGWPVAGDILTDSSYEIQSVRTGTAIELAAESASASQSSLGTRLGNYTRQAQQTWAISALTNAGGYLGSPYFKISIAGTDRVLAATADATLVTVPAFTGAPEQLWRIDQLTDGNWRIMPKAVPNSKDALALSVGSGGSPTLAKFDPASDAQRWRLPELWKDGSLVADAVREGTYEIQSQRSGFVLQLGVEGVTVGGGRGGMRGGPGGAPGGRGGAPGGAAPGAAPGGFGAPGASVEPRTTGEPIVMVGAGDPGAAAPAPAAGARAGGMGGGRMGGGGFGGGMGMGGRGGGAPIPNQDVAAVSPNWPAGNLEVRLGEYMLQAHQRWTITAAANGGGDPAFRISIAGTERTLTATADRELIAAPAFTGGPEQLWRIERLTDGTFSITPKSVPNSTEPLVLTAAGGSTPSLAKLDPKSDKSRWTFMAP